MSRNQTEILIEFLGADTSVPKVRHTMCIVLCFVAPILIGVGIWWWLPDHSYILLCQIIAPLFGLGASGLWLLWPWFRTDIETAHRIMVVTSREIDHDGEQTSEQPPATKVTPIGAVLDRAEKGSYRYVGGALALSWLLTLIPTVQTAWYSTSPSEDITLLSQSLQWLSSAVHHHSQLLEHPLNAEAQPQSNDAAIRELTARISALELKIAPAK